MHIENLQDAYYLLTAISSVVILILSFLLARVQMPQVDSLEKLKRAKFYLSLSYFILGISGLITCSMPQDVIPKASLLFVTASVAAFQALLFTAVHIVFIQPGAITKDFISKHLAYICMAIALFLAIYANEIISDEILETIIIAVYLVQQIVYVNKFNKLYFKNLKKSNIFYDEERRVKLKTLGYCFYGALTVGLLSLISPLIGLGFYIIFIILYTSFYTYMVVILCNKFSTINDIPFTEVNEQQEDNTEENVTETPEGTETPEEIANEEHMKTFKANLAKWVAEKGFLQCDLSVDDVAQILGTDRFFLRNYFRDHIHSDFRTWRSELRIEEAKKLLISHPEYSTSQIGEMVGFNHRSNFFNQFTKITGVSPKAWRDEQEEKKDNE